MYKTLKFYALYIVNFNPLTQGIRADILNFMESIK